MPRALRLESENAAYHVINRGNYKSPIFRSVKTRITEGVMLYLSPKRSS